MKTPWKSKTLHLLATLGLVLVSGVAHAQDDDFGDALDDILSEDPEADESVAEEKRDLLEGDFDDGVGERGDLMGDQKSNTPKVKRLIKTLQHKNFLKINRWEASLNLGFVTNDPFINRYLIGASLIYHPTEIFGLEAYGTFSPNFGEGDWKSVTKQLVNENQVSPDISKINALAGLNLQFAPIYGKVAIGKGITRFDVYGTFGAGIAQTQDDLEALQGETDPAAIATASQVHPTANLGGGVRILFTKSLAARIEGRSTVFIETISSTTLEMKGNFLLLASVSYFFPGMK